MAKTMTKNNGSTVTFLLAEEYKHIALGLISIMRTETKI